MNIGAYGILIIFGAFVLLMILNPKLSCFGKRIKSPLYPLLRKRTQAARKPPPTEDYGFDLGGSKGTAAPRTRARTAEGKGERVENYGFNLQNPEHKSPSADSADRLKQEGTD